MPRIRVKKARSVPDPQRVGIILVEPKTPGNIGAVARTMKNFDFERLILVNPCGLDDEAYARAMHAKDLLDSAKVYKRLSNATRLFDTIVGTTCEPAKSDRHHLRKAINPTELAKKLDRTEDRVAILFGREDYGLYNKELKNCDITVTIPTSDEYPSMNLSHSVAIVLYELFRKGCDIYRPMRASRFEKDKVMEMFQIYLETTGYPVHKREKAVILMKRILGRCSLTKWEFHTLMGIFSGAVKKIGRVSKGRSVKKRR